MSNSYLPNKDAELMAWALNFMSKISPSPEAFGLDEGQRTEYGTAYGAYASAYQVANDSATRTTASVQAKNSAKAALIKLTRELVDICQAWPEMTNDKRALLQITIRDNSSTPVPVPTQSPQLDVVSVQGRTVKVRLRNSENGERRKPAGVQGATIMSYVGPTIPSSLRDWTFEGNTTRVDLPVVFGESVPMGSKVWITAFWYNRRAESGPACSPVAAHVGFGGLVEEIEEAA